MYEDLKITLLIHGPNRVVKACQLTHPHSIANRPQCKESQERNNDRKASLPGYGRARPPSDVVPPPTPGLAEGADGVSEGASSPPVSTTKRTNPLFDPRYKKKDATADNKGPTKPQHRATEKGVMLTANKRARDEDDDEDEDGQKIKRTLRSQRKD